MVIVKNAAGCSATSAIYDYNTGIHDALKNLSISVFPNPNKGVFTVSLTANVPTDVNMSIQNSLGQTVYSKHKITINGKFSELITFDKMVPGMYFLIIKNKEGSSVNKFFVE
jgi:hypothetical protein